MRYNLDFARNLWDLLKNKSTSDILVDVLMARDNPAYWWYTLKSAWFSTIDGKKPAEIM